MEYGVTCTQILFARMIALQLHRRISDGLYIAISYHYLSSTTQSFISKEDLTCSVTSAKQLATILQNVTLHSGCFTKNYDHVLGIRSHNSSRSCQKEVRSANVTSFHPRTVLQANVTESACL